MLNFSISIAFMNSIFFLEISAFFCSSGIFFLSIFLYSLLDLKADSYSLKISFTKSSFCVINFSYLSLS